MSDAVAAATQLHPHRHETAQIGSSRPSQTECWRSGTTSAAASRLRFAHVIHVRDERIASLEWVTGTPSWPTRTAGDGLISHDRGRA